VAVQIAPSGATATANGSPGTGIRSSAGLAPDPLEPADPDPPHPAAASSTHSRTRLMLAETAAGAAVFAA
jgi:hypothetical protein